jgi:nucleoside-diphosphate kinase
MATERTFAMVKPDGVRRGLVGEIVSRFEKKGFKIVAMKMMTPEKALVEEHYGEHKGKPFFDGLVGFLSGGAVVAMCVEGEQVIAEWRRMMGATRPWDSAPGTIRFEYATTVDENVVHGSDSAESAARVVVQGRVVKPHGSEATSHVTRGGAARTPRLRVVRSILERTNWSG